MSKAQVELPDGRKAVIEYDTQEQLDSAINDLSATSSQPPPKSSGPALDPRAPASSGVPQNQLDGVGFSPLRAIGGAAAAIPETALNVGSGLLAFPVKSAASIYQLLTSKSGQRVTNANRAMESVDNAMVYQPRTDAGKAVSQGVGAVLSSPATIGDAAGREVYNATGSPMAGAATSLAIQSVPVVLGARASSAKTAASREAAATVVDAAGKATRYASPEAAAQARAATYATSKLGLDWGAIGQDIRTALTDIARNQTNMDNLPPEAVSRYLRLKELDIPATRGNVTRNVADITREELLSKSDTGQPIRNIQNNQDVRLYELIDQLRPKGANTRQQVGATVQGAIRKQQAVAQKATSDAYTAARNSPESQMVVDPEPLRQWLQDPINAKDSSPVMGLLRGFVPEDGGGIAVGNLERIRQKIQAAANSSDGTVRHTAGEAKDIIDTMMEGAGGELYAKARALHRAERAQFGDNALNAKLVENKGADPRVAIEDTFDTVVLRGSNAQLETLRKSLISGGDPATLKQGAQAWDALKSATIDHLKSKATEALNEEGNAGFKGAAFLKAVREMDADGKLDTLFGKADANRLRTIVKAVEDVRTKPQVRIDNSHSGANVVAMFDSFAEKVKHVPVIGKAAEKAAGVVESFSNLGKDKRDVRNALSNPVEDAKQNSLKSSEKEARRNALRKYSGAAVPAAAEQNR